MAYVKTGQSEWQVGVQEKSYIRTYVFPFACKWRVAEDGDLLVIDGETVIGRFEKDYWVHVIKTEESKWVDDPKPVKKGWWQF